MRPPHAREAFRVTPNFDPFSSGVPGSCFGYPKPSALFSLRGTAT